ncbi:MAG: hypothetical protein OJF49_003702 [Ktedonobacterales bacterium]|jgi:hypothetical protein|nr:MAG: hypothetical protein OJF49_003702 [Ktedonobacterales bacterium]
MDDQTPPPFFQASPQGNTDPGHFATPADLSRAAPRRRFFTGSRRRLLTGGLIALALVLLISGVAVAAYNLGQNNTAAASAAPTATASAKNARNPFRAVLTVTALNGNTITATTKGGMTVTITTTANTKFISGGAAMDLSSIQPGMHIRVKGKRNGASAIIATEIDIVTSTDAGKPTSTPTAAV